MSTTAFLESAYDHEPPVTLLDNVDTLKKTIEESPVRTNKLSLSAIRGLAGQSKEKSARLLEASPRHLLERLSGLMEQTWSIPWRTAKKQGDKLLQSESLCSFIEQFHRAGLPVQTFVAAFLHAAAVKEKENERAVNIRALQDGTHEVCSLALAGDSIDFQGKPVGKNHISLFQNIAENYLRLLGVVPEIDPDQPYADKFYLFAGSNTPTDFATRTVMQQSGVLIHDRDVLEIGPGNGADAQHFLEAGARSVEVIDASEFVLANLHLRKSRLSSEYQSKMVIPRGAQDMCDALLEMTTEGRRFDLMYANSSIHFLDRTHLKQLFNLVSHSLRSGGHFAFSVKAPGATMDGHGIRLINDVDNEDRDRHPFGGVNDRAWLNHDGQVRHYMSLMEWDEILAERFHVMDASKSHVSGYATPDREQLFLNFICRRKNDHIVLSESAQDDIATGDSGTDFHIVSDSSTGQLVPVT